MWDSKKVARNWFDLFSDLGGLYSAIFFFFTYVAANINEKKWITKQIRQLFIQRNHKGEGGDKINLTVSKMYGKSEEAKALSEFFEKGRAKLERSLDIFRVIQILQKMQAAISVLLTHQDEKSVIFK